MSLFRLPKDDKSWRGKGASSTSSSLASKRLESQTRRGLGWEPNKEASAAQPKAFLRVLILPLLSRSHAEGSEAGRKQTRPEKGKAARHFSRPASLPLKHPPPGAGQHATRKGDPGAPGSDGRRELNPARELKVGARCARAAAELGSNRLRPGPVS
ncbi:uncharacterized protein VTP21DRAFT_6032 [Calcarisporiella thermophila]|uniref:uncharacterized protein n=1 Tax=Calcarisporiella thermophila TaxID=911321 RepID=UPI0037442E0D